MNLDPPVTLPAGLSHLSASSVGLFLRDTEKWRRRYIEGEYEPSSGAAIVGSAVGRAEGVSFQEQITTGSRLLVGDVLDCFADEWEVKVAEDNDRGGIDWQDERPGRVKDQGARVLALFHRAVAPRIRPATVERKFEIALPGVDWTFYGYTDVEEHNGGIGDIKVRSHTRGPVTPDEADGDLQATGYLWARSVEARGENAPRWLTPAPVFRYLNMVRPSTPHTAPRPASVVVTPTTRSEEQLDTFMGLLYRVAAEMAWRVEYDIWTGAKPGDPLCSPKWCGFWDTCAFGGAHRPPAAARPAPVRKPRPDDWLDAVRATARKDKTTSSERVGHHLGVSKQSAANALGSLARKGALESKVKRRKGSRPTTAFAIADPGDVAGQLEASITHTNGKPREEIPA